MSKKTKKEKKKQKKALKQEAKLNADKAKRREAREAKSQEKPFGKWPYENEPFVDFTISKNKLAFERALEKVAGELGKEHPMVIGGERLETEKKFTSHNPSRISEIIGTFQDATPDFAEKAIEVAAQTFETWKDVSPTRRAAYLFKAAKLMRKRKHEFSAAMVYEVSKNWAEADADTAEAIDFLEFYAREALRYAAKQPVVPSPLPEKNELVYIPLGVGIILPPFNFPLAIAVGMAMAAVVAGNTVVMKPSPDAPFIAYKFVQLMEEVGLPKGVLNFVTGGADLGEAMVVHPKTRFIAFTGSKAIGLHINEIAAKTTAGQKWIKRVIVEMGGKDAIIVDREANLDAAADGVIASAFGFQGQKCSACSRAIVDEQVYDEFLVKLTERAARLRVGNAAGNPNVAAVVNERSLKKALSYIEQGKQDGKLLFGGQHIKADGEEGHYLEPTIIADILPKSKLEQEEVFAPVLAVIKATDYAHALEIANDTEFGLTGAVYSENKEKIKEAREKFFVGNLYLNRKCTGALVGVHPFGGFNMSGTDSKAGGRDYLLLFLQAKSIATKV
jgi:1-pyrroline-5-carboxylate dehydrogenase